MNYRDALNQKAQKTKTKETWEIYKQQKNRVNNIKMQKSITTNTYWKKIQLNQNNFGSVLKTCSLLNQNMKPYVQNLNLMVKW